MRVRTGAVLENFRFLIALYKLENKNELLERKREMAKLTVFSTVASMVMSSAVSTDEEANKVTTRPPSVFESRLTGVATTPVARKRREYTTRMKEFRGELKGGALEEGLEGQGGIDAKRKKVLAE